MELNPAEVHIAAWASPDQLRKCFDEQEHSEMEAYEFDTNVFLHQNPNLKVSTDHLYPAYARKGAKNKHN